MNLTEGRPVYEVYCYVVGTIFAGKKFKAYKGKVKQSLYRPGQAFKGPRG
jgi:hypothetical protein